MPDDLHDTGADLAVGSVVFLLPGRELGLAPLATVRDDQASAPVVGPPVRDTSRTRSSSGRLHGRPLRTGSAPSRRSAVISLPNSLGPF